jgi:archaellum component FlaF (FlaF/FlaG flagellin family)
MATMNPSPTKPVVRYPTALLEDKELVTIHDSRLPDYKALEYGAPYPDQNKFPGLKLIFQEPLEDDRMVRRVWAGDRKDQDLYNSDRKYSGGSTEHPILIRRYLFPEDGYEPVPTGTPDSQFPEAVLVEEEVARPENRNGYLAVTRVFETLPGPLLTGVQITEKGQIATITTQVVEPGTTVTPSALVIGGSVKPTSKGKSVLEQLAVPEVFGEKTFSKEVPDPVPEKFRVAIPTETTEETVEGQAAAPTLVTGDIAKSEQQVTKFTKRKRATKRDRTKLPKKLTQIGTGTERRKKYIEETLQLGDTTRDTSPTVSVQSEAMGDGTYLVRTEDDVEIFTGASFNVEATDPTPQKFRNKLPIRTEERNEVGPAFKPELQPGEISQSLDQLDKFNRRRRKVYRAIETLPVGLAQTETTSQGLKAAVTETLQRGDTTEQPSATLAIQSEALGDGNYVVRRTQLPEVFPENSVSLERPDTAPQKFRAALPTATTEETVEGQVEEVSLGAGELAASEQQVTKHTKRTRRVSRNAATLPQTLVQTDTNDKGQRVTVSETYQQGNTNESPTATSQIQSEALGDGTYVVRKSTVTRVFDGKQIQISIPEETMPERFRAAIPTEVLEETVTGSVANSLSLTGSEISKSEQQLTEHTKRTRRVARRATTSTPTLKGQNYDATLNVVYPYEEKITNSGASLGRPNTEVSPISGTQDLVREFDPRAIGEALSQINLTFPSRTSLTLPPVLKEVRLVWDITQESGTFRGSGSGGGVGETWSYDVKGQGEARAEAGVMPGWIVDIEEVWASGVPTTSHIFFLPYPVTESQILARLGVLRWPVFKPRSHTLVAFGKKIAATQNSTGSSGASISSKGRSWSSANGNGNSYGTSSTSVTLKIPPCLHRSITVKETKKAEATAGSVFSVGQRITGVNEDGTANTAPIISGAAGAKAKAEVTVDLNLGWTNPTDIPRGGRYLIESRVEPYQYGFARVYAEVLDAGIFR